MKRIPVLPALAAAAVFAAGCASTPTELDPDLEPFTALSVKTRNVLAEEIREKDPVVAALVDVDMRSDPRITLLRYTPVRFRADGTGKLDLHALAPEEAFPSMSGLREAFRKRHAKGTVGIVVFLDGSAVGTPGREFGERESAALSEVLVSHLQPMLEESKIPFAWIVPTSARLFPILK